MSDEITIPRSRGAVVGVCVIWAIIVLFSILAISNLLAGAARVASSIWLALVLLLTVASIRKEGGFAAWRRNRLNEFASRRFVQLLGNGSEPQEIRFGFVWQ
jgi:hypothetical protein